MNRNMMSILSKMLPKCNHYVGTAHGISTLCYGGENDYLGGTGQGNVFLEMFVEMCHV